MYLSKYERMCYSKVVRTSSSEGCKLNKGKSEHTISLDGGPKIILIDKGRIIDEIPMSDFETRTIQTHQGEIISAMQETVTYYQAKK